MKSLAFFNNKGGVGKTTLACNIAAYFALDQGWKVLVIDGDPQCNSTRLILDPLTCDEIYWDHAVNRSSRTTLADIVAPMEEGDISLDTGSAVLTLASQNRFGVDLLHGDPQLSIFEDLLGKWWADASGGDLGAIRKTNWVNMLLESYQDYDLVIFDLGPSLGSLNRSVLLACDYFVSPVGPDTFSVVALSNIYKWITQWAKTYEQNLGLCEQKFPGKAENYTIAREVKPLEGFAGYTTQQYITATIRGERRATQAYESILNRVPAEIVKTLGNLAGPGIDPSRYRLGDVPHLYSLVPLAQSSNCPIGSLSGGDGLSGGQYAQQKRYKDLIESVGTALALNMGMSNG